MTQAIALGLISGTFSGVAIASVIAMMVVPDLRATKATPDRIAECHAQEGTARLDRRGIYRGCLVPPARGMP